MNGILAHDITLQQILETSLLHPNVEGSPAMTGSRFCCLLTSLIDDHSRKSKLRVYIHPKRACTLQCYFPSMLNMPQTNNQNSRVRIAYSKQKGREKAAGNNGPGTRPFYRSVLLTRCIAPSQPQQQNLSYAFLNCSFARFVLLQIALTIVP